MSKPTKIATLAAVIILAGMVAATMFQPTAAIWSRAEYLRQVFSLGIAGIVLAFTVARLEQGNGRGQPPPDAP